MARTLFDPGIYSVLTSGSAIGSGWLLNFYLGGTASRTTTYNARTAGSANANPVVADSTGRFGAIWLTQGETIKWVLTDANGVVKVTLDDVLVTTAPATTSADLANFFAGTAALPIANGGTASTSAVNALTALGALPLAGGTVTANITRSTKGVHLFWETAAMNNGNVFLTASGAPDPRGALPGQIWLKY